MEPCAPGPAQQCAVWGPAVATAPLQTAVPRAPVGFCFCLVSLPPRNACAGVRVLIPGCDRAEFPLCSAASAQTGLTQGPPASIRPLLSGTQPGQIKQQVWTASAWSVLWPPTELPDSEPASLESCP